MLGALRAENAFAECRLDFVVQDDNFEEMEDFVALGRKVGADGVHFLQIRNWRTYQPSEFRTLAVARRDHPKHDRLRQFLERPCFAKPFVDLGNVAPLRAQRRVPHARLPRSVKKLGVFAGARSGTNYLFEILQSFREICVFAEIFNTVGAFGLQYDQSSGLNYLIEQNGMVFASVRDPRL